MCVCIVCVCACALVCGHCVATRAVTTHFVKLCTEQQQLSTLVSFVETLRLHTASTNANATESAAVADAVTTKLNALVQEKSWSRVLHEVLALPGVEARLLTAASDDGMRVGVCSLSVYAHVCDCWRLLRSFSFAPARASRRRRKRGAPSAHCVDAAFFSD